MPLQLLHIVTGTLGAGHWTTSGVLAKLYNLTEITPNFPYTFTWECSLDLSVITLRICQHQVHKFLQKTDMTKQEI